MWAFEVWTMPPNELTLGEGRRLEIWKRERGRERYARAGWELGMVLVECACG